MLIFADYHCKILKEIIVCAHSGAGPARQMEDVTIGC
jgi:hypothetical protein